MASRWEQFDSEGCLLLKEGERIISITPEDTANCEIWWALIQFPCEVIDFAKEKEKRNMKNK